MLDTRKENLVSGGQKQRVAMCGSCCPETSYLILDEGYKYVGPRGTKRTDSDSSRDSKRSPDDSRLIT